MLASLLIVTIVVLTTIGSLLFYWFQYRPSRIRHDCSWVKEMVGYEPAKPAMTEKELLAKGIIDNCDSVSERLIEEVSLNCGYLHKHTVETYKIARPEMPAKEHWRQSTDIEYKFCLRDKGI